MAGSKGGMPCTLCPHVGCRHSFARMGVIACPECEAGAVVLDPVSGPKWRLDCNLCSFLIYLPDNLHDVKLAKEHCQVG
jgi:DNA topoisomerase-3